MPEWHNHPKKKKTQLSVFSGVFVSVWFDLIPVWKQAVGKQSGIVGQRLIYFRLKCNVSEKNGGNKEREGSKWDGGGRDRQQRCSWGIMYVRKLRRVKFATGTGVLPSSLPFTPPPCFSHLLWPSKLHTEPEGLVLIGCVSQVTRVQSQTVSIPYELVLNNFITQNSRLLPLGRTRNPVDVSDDFWLRHARKAEGNGEADSSRQKDDSESHNWREAWVDGEGINTRWHSDRLKTENRLRLN